MSNIAEAVQTLFHVLDSVSSLQFGICYGLLLTFFGSCTSERSLYILYVSLQYSSDVS